jgi:hypothetical protein
MKETAAQRRERREVARQARMVRAWTKLLQKLERVQNTASVEIFRASAIEALADASDPEKWRTERELERRAAGGKSPRRRSRPQGGANRCPAMRNGRCRLHGGLSTGPRTYDGLEALRRARTVHGFYSAHAIEERRSARAAYHALTRWLATHPAPP